MKLFFAVVCMSTFSLLSLPSLADSENLSAALVDIAGNKICEKLQNRFRGLQSETSSGEKAYSGTLWIHSCQANLDKEQEDVMTLQLGVRGWRWLERNKEKLGADFKISEFARFRVNVAMTGRVIAHYQPDSKRMAFWFKPETAPKVDFNASGDVDVDKEGLWASVLASTATLVGQSPDTIADEKLVSKGEQRFKDKIADGFSASVDFCSGRVVSELGQLDRETLLTKLDKKQQAKFNSVSLEPSSFLLFGPYGEQSEHLDLELKLKRPADFKNKLICMNDAIELAKAYMEGNDRTPEVPSIKLVDGKDNQDQVSLRNVEKTCPVVAMFATDKSVSEIASFEFKVRDYSDPKPLMKCD